MALRATLQAQAVRQAYERHPYPAATDQMPVRARWRLPPVTWLTAMWRPGEKRFEPRRILVAGCGTGHEAFAIAKRVPGAEVVGVDFSPRAIAIARRLRRRLPSAPRIRFMVADVNDRRLPALTGGRFDFVSCHGVLSYVPHPDRALKQLARCLGPGGALYIGVNGETHHSVRWRATLPAFGLDPAEWRETPATRRTLRLLDAMADRTRAPRLARRSTSYLASDVFGSPIRNLPLSGWLALTRKAGLHFRGSLSCGDSLKGVAASDQTRQLVPRSRANVHEIEELLIPSAFHRLLFTREPVSSPPWDRPRDLLDWRPVRLPLYRTTLPKRAHGVVRLSSPALNARVDIPYEPWTAALLGRSARPRSLREVLDGLPRKVRTVKLRDELYLLYLLAVIDLLPPAPSPSAI